MIGTNSKLHRAKADAFDEFYTRVADIESAVPHFDLKGMNVYSPCDDYRWSAFARYFTDHFDELGIASYTCTNYDNGDGAWKYEYDGHECRVTKLEGDGDFRGSECMAIAATSDVIVTNPPFSLFREYVTTLMGVGVKFILIGNQNAVTYREIFPHFKENRMWWGPGCVRWFSVPDSYDKNVRVIDGLRCAEGARSRWYTNVDHDGRNEMIDLTESYDPQSYPMYENCDAIDVDRTDRIPADYDGVMGVPITFLDRYCPEQFEIVRFRKGDDGKDLRVGGKEPFFRILIRRI